MQFKVLVLPIILMGVISRRNTVTVEAILHFLILLLLNLGIVLAVYLEKFLLRDFDPFLEPILIFFGASNFFLHNEVKIEAPLDRHFNKEIFPVTLE